MTDEFNYAGVARLLALLDQAEGSDLEFTFDGLRVTVTAWDQTAATNERPAATVDNAAPDEATAPAVARPHGDDIEFRQVGIPAPAVGFFRSMPPSEAPNTGTAVTCGQPLGEIIGASGKRVTLTASHAGELTDWCVEQGEFVQYGQIVAVIARAATAADQSQVRGVDEET